MISLYIVLKTQSHGFLPTREILPNQNPSSTVFCDIKQLRTHGKPHLQPENYSVNVILPVTSNFWIVICIITGFVSHSVFTTRKQRWLLWCQWLKTIGTSTNPIVREEFRNAQTQLLAGQEKCRSVGPKGLVCQRRPDPTLSPPRPTVPCPQTCPQGNTPGQVPEPARAAYRVPWKVYLRRPLKADRRQVLTSSTTGYWTSWRGLWRRKTQIAKGLVHEIRTRILPRGRTPTPPSEMKT